MILLQVTQHPIHTPHLPPHFQHPPYIMMLFALVPGTLHYVRLANSSDSREYTQLPTTPRYPDIANRLLGGLDHFFWCLPMPAAFSLEVLQLKVWIR